MGRDLTREEAKQLLDKFPKEQRNYIKAQSPAPGFIYYPPPPGYKPAPTPKSCQECQNQGTIEGCSKCGRMKGNEQHHKQVNAKPAPKIFVPCACGTIDYRDCTFHSSPRKDWRATSEELDAAFGAVLSCAPVHGDCYIFHGHVYVYRDGKWLA